MDRFQKILKVQIFERRESLDPIHGSVGTHGALRTDISSRNSKVGSPFSRGAQHQAKRAAILSRAAKLFNTKGARSTTLADVANKLGLTKTSLYYYVRTKEDLIFQCYQSALARLHQSLDEVEAETNDSRERVLRAMERHIEISLDSLADRGDYYAAPLGACGSPEENRSL